MRVCAHRVCVYDVSVMQPQTRFISHTRYIWESETGKHAGDLAGMESAFWNHVLNAGNFSVEYGSDVPGAGLATLYTGS